MSASEMRPTGGRTAVMLALVGALGAGLLYLVGRSTGPSIVTGAASEIGMDAAILQATPKNLPTGDNGVYFEYGLAGEAYVYRTAIKPTAATVSARVGSLLADTEYRYRAVLMLASGQSVVGGSVSFRTSKLGTVKGNPAKTAVLSVSVAAA